MSHAAATAASAASTGPADAAVSASLLAVSSASASASAAGTSPLASGASAGPSSPLAPHVAEVPVSPGDPFAGKFTLADAVKGLPGKGPLYAEIKTDKGVLSCDLYDDRAPITVANFVGLARGVRPWKSPEGAWVKKAAYDGTTFHRVIPGFMIQGGDALGNGTGEPGYVIPDEIWAGSKHDRAGQLCMANRGKNTNGAQFFITDGAPHHLDGGYTIFGSCTPTSLVSEIAKVPARGDRATAPVKIEKIVIKRGRAKKKA